MKNQLLRFFLLFIFALGFLTPTNNAHASTIWEVRSTEYSIPNEVYPI